MIFRAFVFTVAIALAGCEPGEPPIPVIVGAGNTTEQKILAELVAQTIEGAGMVAQRKSDLGGPAERDAAIRAGKIDVYVEYTGVALITILRSPSSTSVIAAGPDTVLERVRSEYAHAGLVWTAPLGFDSPYALVVRAGTGGLTISESVASARNWRAGFTIDFQQRNDFYPALKRGYGLEFAEIRTVAGEDPYKPLLDHQVDMIVGHLTDAALARPAIRALEDDRRVLPAFRAAPVVRRASLEQNPALAGALDGLADTLDTPTMRRLNEQVDIAGKTPAQAAEEFLDSMSLF